VFLPKPQLGIVETGLNLGFKIGQNLVVASFSGTGLRQGFVLFLEHKQVYSYLKLGQCPDPTTPWTCLCNMETYHPSRTLFQGQKAIRLVILLPGPKSGPIEY
jgi:hypothetical protein